MQAIRTPARHFAVIVAVCLIFCPRVPVRAANPKITLKLSNVTAAEALKALTKASGVSLELEDLEAFAKETGFHVEFDQSRRVSFDWSNVALSRAMHDFSEKLHLGFEREDSSDGYRVSPWVYRPPAAPLPVVCERNDLRVSVLTVRTQEQRRVILDGSLKQGFRHTQLMLLVEVPDQDASIISSVANITAKDDRGNIWSCGGGRASPPTRDAYPDQWLTFIELPRYATDIHKLLWLEGDVERRGPYREDRLSIPFPLLLGRTQYEKGNLTVDVRKLELTNSGFRQGPTAELAIDCPAFHNMRSPFHSLDEFDGLRVALCGASGKLYYAEDGMVTGDGAPSHVTCRWRPVPEEITALRITSREQDGSKRLGSFRLVDIPLPNLGVVLRPRETTSASQQKVQAPKPAFLDPAGGSLSGAVKIPDRRISPAPAVPVGDVSYGLSPVLPDEVSVPAWVEVPLLRGAGKLEHVKPGKYRVLRVYRPEGTPDLAAPGRWLNTEIIVEVRAGIDTVLPPLEWRPDPEPMTLPAK